MNQKDNFNSTNDATKKLDTNDNNRTYENLDEKLSKLVLGRGRNQDHMNQALRRPSGLGSFVKPK